MVLFQFFLVFTIVYLTVNGKKRLLDNDPDTINSRLLYLERELQTTKAELHTTTSELHTTKIQMQTMDAIIQQMTSKVRDLETSGKGATYIRWGRQTCSPNSTELVYAGVVGGGYYTKTGAAVNYVCLPHDPDLLTNVTATNPQGLKGQIYGAEYEDNLFGSNVFDRDVPCAVCHASQKSSTLMIPGRNRCYSGWSVEYQGKLATGYESSAAASEYVCLDNNPDVLEHSYLDNDGKLFYPVSAKCGSLSCPPYVDGAFLTCVVCSK